MRDNGYFVMVSGKDDLTKKAGCGIDGRYRLNNLGFDAQRRCKGKSDNTVSYPTITDPFAVYLSEHYNVIQNGSNVSEWYIRAQCMKHCCTNHACETIDVHTAAYEDNYITDNTLELLDQAPKDQPWFLQINWAGPHPPC